MNKEEAIAYLSRDYFCCCQYGTGINNCGDSECTFGQAIRTLIQEANNDNQVGEDSAGYRS